MTVKETYLQKFRERFVITSPISGSIIGQPMYIGREQQEVDDILAFLSEALDVQREEIIKEAREAVGKGDWKEYMGTRFANFIVWLERKEKDIAQLKGKTQ